MTAHNGIINVDHPVVAAQDLDAARIAFERLGFTVPPRGSHVEWGTGNLCIMFPEDYLEIRGIIDASRFTMHLDEHLDRYGEGLMGVAFGTDDAPLVKFNPLAEWSSADVWQYIRDNDVPYNPLHDQGFVSIGCEPCTRPVGPHEHERSGRWWWEDATRKECGLHAQNVVRIVG